MIGLLLLMAACAARGECVPPEALSAARDAAQASGRAEQVAERWFAAADLFEKALSAVGCTQDTVLLYNVGEAVRRGLEASPDPPPQQICRMNEYYQGYLAVSQDDELRRQVRDILAQYDGACPPPPLPVEEPTPVESGNDEGQSEFDETAGDEDRESGEAPSAAVVIDEPSIDGPERVGGVVPPERTDPIPEPLPADPSWLVGGSLAVLAGIAVGAGAYYIDRAVDSTDAARTIAEAVDCNDPASHLDVVERFEEHAENARSERLLGGLALGVGAIVGGVATWWFLRDAAPPAARSSAVRPQVGLDTRSGAWSLGMSGRF